MEGFLSSVLCCMKLCCKKWRESGFFVCFACGGFVGLGFFFGGWGGWSFFLFFFVACVVEGMHFAQCLLDFEALIVYHKHLLLLYLN